MSIKQIKEFFNCSSAEIIELKKESPEGFEELKTLVEDHYTEKNNQ